MSTEDIDPSISRSPNPRSSRSVGGSQPPVSSTVIRTRPSSSSRAPRRESSRGSTACSIAFAQASQTASTTSCASVRLIGAPASQRPHGVAHEIERVDVARHAQPERPRGDGEQPNRQEGDVVSSLLLADHRARTCSTSCSGSRGPIDRRVLELLQALVDGPAAALDEPVRIEEQHRADRELEDLLPVLRIGPCAEREGRGRPRRTPPCGPDRRPGAEGALPT